MSLGDSKSGSSKVALNPVLGDILSLVSAAMYAVYITLIRKKLPDDDGKSGHASMAQFLGYLGLFNMLIFLPIPLVLNFANLEPFNTLTWKQLGLIVGKGIYLSISCFFPCTFKYLSICVHIFMVGHFRGKPSELRLIWDKQIAQMTHKATSLCLICKYNLSKFSKICSFKNLNFK